MKKVLLLVSAVAVLVSCNKAGDNEYVITGTIKGIADGKLVILEGQDSLGVMKPIDTAKVEKEKFTFKGSSKEPAMHLIGIEALGKVPLILENGDIEITVDKDSLQKSKVKGTYNNDELTSYVDADFKMYKKFESDHKVQITQAQQKQDMIMLQELQKQYMEVATAQNEKYIGGHPKSFIAALLIQRMFTIPDADLAKIKKYYEALDPEIKNTKPGKEIKKRLAEIEQAKAAQPTAEATPTGNAVGDQAPEFSAKTPDGKTMSLKQALGKVTIVDFWASWCGPCRKENPNVVALYNELHSKGLNIIGVSLDKDAKAWKEAIGADKLTWNHVSNLMYWNEPIAKTYGIEAVPATFILDANGKIVAKNLTGAALKAKVSELLAAK
ncbi:redoxin domain-containing protein [Flavobacterium sp.]|uniref:redoxin domain-containing protein n=1 Tax=Flavobacterium sp. TaxID=239 RepID=UPI0039E2D4B0